MLSRGGLGFVAGGAVAIAAVGLAKAWPLNETLSIAVPGAGALLMLVLGVLAGARGKVTIAEGAGRLDEAHGLKDRLTSAVEMAERGGAFASLAVADAERVASDVNVGRATPVRPGRSWPAGAVLLALAAGMWLLIPPRDPEVPTVLAASTPAERAEAGERIEDVIEQMQATEPPAEGESTAVADAISELEALQDRLERGEMDAEDALASAAEQLEDAAEESESKAQAAAETQRAISDAAESAASEAEGLAKELAEGLAEGDLERASEAARLLREQAGRMPPEARDRLARDLESLSEALGETEPLEPEPSPEEELADELRERVGDLADVERVAEELEREGLDSASARDLAEQLAEEERRRQQREQTREDIERMRDALEETARDVREQSEPPAETEQPSEQSGEQPGEQPEPAAEPAVEDEATRPPQEEQTGEPERKPGEKPQEQPGQQQSEPGEKPRDEAGETENVESETGESESAQESQGEPRDTTQPGVEDPSQKVPGERESERGETPTEQTGEPSEQQMPSESQEGEEPPEQSGERPEQQPDEQTGEETGEQPGEQPASEPTGEQPGEAAEPSPEGEQPGGTPEEVFEESPEGATDPDSQEMTEKQPGEKQPGQSGPEGVEDQPEAGEPGSPEDGAEGAGSGDESSPLERELDRLAERQRQREMNEQQAREMRRRAQELLDEATPQEREQLKEWADRLAEQNRLSGSTEPWEASEEVVDARPAEPTGADEQVLAEWYNPEGEPMDGASSGEASAARLREAVKSAERAVEQQRVPTRYQKLVRDVFRRVQERAARQESGAGAGAAPLGEDAKNKSESDDDG